jgi:hypothetical protein
MSLPTGRPKASSWEKASSHPRWGRPLQRVVNGVVIAGAAFALLSAAVVIFFGLFYGW